MLFFLFYYLPSIGHKTCVGRIVMEMVKQTERNYVTQSANGYIKQENQLQTHSVTIQIYQLIQVCFIFLKIGPKCIRYH